jgi:hypothetical protein
MNKFLKLILVHNRFLSEMNELVQHGTECECCSCLWYLFALYDSFSKETVTIDIRNCIKSYLARPFQSRIYLCDASLQPISKTHYRFQNWQTVQRFKTICWSADNHKWRITDDPSRLSYVSNTGIRVYSQSIYRVYMVCRLRLMKQIEIPKLYIFSDGKEVETLSSLVTISRIETNVVEYKLDNRKLLFGNELLELQLQDNFPTLDCICLEWIEFFVSRE